ncbi:hypothetical protein HF324_05010 [Chitinophaga oryzae]|uniref:Uncharacterized protein n=1 Tax=Chitinophaga oryzae TaxID=2725414 RepID=A0ABX6LBU1_9BACT|nr:hypothetical protein [Chitinophaga oryzae]QJB37245.1 hypothetical protein HF324_05010 [Chitinophaga oryzae]
MKSSFLLLAGSLFAFSTAVAQKDSSGIYQTAADFQQKKLSYAINYRTEKHKIRTNILFDGNEIKVKHDGRTYTMDKARTYGFKDTKGNVYRFVDRKEYRVLNPEESILIYEFKHLAHSPKDAQTYQPEYFFSKDAVAELQPLTKANLKAAFPDNHKFHDALELQFRRNEELIEYDSHHKVYKLNRIYTNNQ